MNGGTEDMEETAPTNFSTEESIKCANNCIRKACISNIRLSSEEKICRLLKLLEVDY